MMKRWVLLAAAFARGGAALSTNALFSDGMVIQGTDVNGGGVLTPPTTLFGEASPNEVVTLTGASFPGSPYTTHADSQGSWSITLAPALAGHAAGPFELTLKGSAGGAPIVARDVYIGEVFLCSGQSNMERTVDYIVNASAELAAAEHPLMRMFQVPSPVDLGPKGPWHTPSRALNGSCLYCKDKKCHQLPGKGCDSPRRTWAVVNSSTVAKFSAVCYLAVRDAMRMIGALDHPIGLIESDWGGTPVQAWSPPEALKSCGQPTDDCPTEPNGDCKNYPSVLYNHMLYPLVGYGLRSVLWYQGEANSDEGFPLHRDAYACAFGAMIDSWRKAWGAPEMPFVWMQLSSWFGNWGFDGLPCVQNYCPVISRIRLAQADAAGLSPSDRPKLGARKRVGMAVSYDFGDNQAHGVHSRYKSEPSRRLALQLLTAAYDPSTYPVADPALTSAPLPLSARLATRKGADVKVRVELSHAAEGLHLQPTTMCNVTYSKECCTANAAGPLMGRICTSKNVTACAAIHDGSTLVLANVTVDGSSIVASATLNSTSDTPRWLDLGLTDFPECVVVNSRGLALGPFGPLAITSDA